VTENFESLDFKQKSFCKKERSGCVVADDKRYLKKPIENQDMII